MSSKSPFEPSWLARLLDRWLGWSSVWQWPPPPPSSDWDGDSGTLDGAQAPIELTESQATAIQHLEDVSDGVATKEVTAFVVFSLEGDGAMLRYYRAPGAELEPLAAAIQTYGVRLQRQIARAQGNAPPQNRSDRDQ